MKRFGTPPHSLDYFLNKLKCFSNDLKLYLVTKDGLVVAALMGFTCGKNIHITKNPSLKKFWNCRPNDLAHWEFIKWGCEHGYTSFDFGPVRYENQKRYKEKWGAKIQNNYIFYLYPENSRLRQGYGGQAKPSKQNLTTHNLGFKFISFIWKYFIPISLAQHLGPIIRKRLAR
ncbi:GNAT family N-acetyltransferase [Patescibacteria group bacterium]|nr:GNAT family N-acetyltransferase [Patescibacteria group bacterium]MCG2692558.1 GNAT family N-acetyltransferase [Candidatus Parcubacteria bacterium]